jgi:transposase
VQGERIAPQYQEDIVRRTVVRRFPVEVGHGSCGGARAHGRHPLPTSDALGAAKVQIGPEALVWGAHLNQPMGLSLGHPSRGLATGYGLEFSRGGIYQALARLASQAEPSYPGRMVTARQSLVNWVDATGWRVGGHSQWWWAAVSELVTVYSILPGRGSVPLKRILGAGYDAWILPDGLRCYSSLD